MSSAAMNIDYREFEKAGFSKEQTDVLKQAIEISSQHDETIKREIELCETRIEKSMKEMEVRLIREMSKFQDRFSKIDSDLRLIKGAGALLLAVITLGGTIFSALHLHVVMQ